MNWAITLRFLMAILVLVWFADASAPTTLADPDTIIGTPGKPAPEFDIPWICQFTQLIWLPLEKFWLQFYL